MYKYNLLVDWPDCPLWTREPEGGAGGRDKVREKEREMKRDTEQGRQRETDSQTQM